MKICIPEKVSESFFLFPQHGEPGAAVTDLQPVDVVVSHILKQILSAVCSITVLNQIIFSCFYLPYLFLDVKEICIIL